MRRIFRHSSRLVIALLVIEFLDEWLYGMFEAAWPLIRADFNLTYAQIGLLLSIPSLIATLIEPVIGILGDLWRRRLIIIMGGLFLVVGVLLQATGHTYTVLLVALIVQFPSSGAFVGLAQATLMDVDPERHEQNMARWAFAGSVGVVLGPVMLAALLPLGVGWRVLLMVWSGVALIGVLFIAHSRFPAMYNDKDEDNSSVWASLKAALALVRQPTVWRWLILLEFSDLMLDGLHSYLALYLVDVAGMSAAHAGWGVAVWTGVGLIGDLLLIPLLERVRGLTYLRYSALFELLLYPAFLLVPGLEAKLIILALLGLLNAGWYAILKGQLYSAMSGYSGTAMGVSSITSLASGLLPLVIGLIATRYGLQVAMWPLLLGPIALLIGLPRR